MKTIRKKVPEPTHAMAVGEPNPSAAILHEAVRAKCADCDTFAYATPSRPNATCRCGKLKIVKREIVEGNTGPFTEGEFVTAFMQGDDPI